MESLENQKNDTIEIAQLLQNVVKEKENSEQQKKQKFKCQEWGFNFVPTLAHIATKKIDQKIVQTETQKSLPETVQETENKEKENPKQQQKLIFKCHRCHKVLDSAFDLKLHLTRLHDTDQEFEKKLNDFQSLPEASLYRCLKCSFRTNASDQMISHHVEKHVTILQQ